MKATFLQNPNPSSLVEKTHPIVVLNDFDWPIVNLTPENAVVLIRELTTAVIAYNAKYKNAQVKLPI